MKYTDSHVVIPGLTGNLLSIWKVLPLAAVVVLLAACGDDPKVGGTEEDAGIIAIENKTVSGVSQKGPFVNGSSVKLYEMDGETLAPTGKSFPGKIASDDGRFTVPSISLASQYALLEANGYFRNEITGGKSNGTITLNALTDLSDREKVNINLLTHLEYERALYLVGNGVKVSEAKKQAESEILDAFEIKGEFENSEDLDIFSSGDGNAALLAFSVLMLGNLTEADLTERLTNFATDVEQDGKWDDEKTKAIIADWASGMSLADGLAGIRNNIAGWNFSNDVPAFEKYVNNFWWQNYGLGTCVKERQGEVKINDNVLSVSSGAHFICDNNAWRVATDIEKDTATWGIGKFNGEIRAGQVNKTIYYFFESSNNVWREASALEYDTYQVICSEDGIMLNGTVNTTTKYVCDNSVFRAANEIEIEADSACTSYNRNKYYILPKYDGKNNYSYYKCSEEGWFFTTEKLNQDSMIDERDGHEYKIIGIGTQMWMAENLNYADSINYPSMIGKNWCNEDRDSCLKYGRLYQWVATMNIDDRYEEEYAISILSFPHQGICPSGWHVPQRIEWQNLITFIRNHVTDNNEENIPIYLIEDEWRYSDDGKTRKGLNSFGMGILPFDGGSSAWYHSADEHPTYGHGTVVFGFDISFYLYDVYGFLEKRSAFPVRCVKDEE